MIVTEKRLDELVPYTDNPRRNEEAIEAVQNSIKDFGFLNPIIINEENVILAGHTRYAAAQRLGRETVPCIVVSELSEEQERAFRLADNKVAEKALWDFEKLEEEINSIEQDVSVYGLERPELADIDLNSVLGDKRIKTIVCPCCGETVEL